MNEFGVISMRSFKLASDIVPEGVVTLPFVAVHWYWSMRIQGFDFGENDFSGFFYLIITLFLLFLAAAGGVVVLIIGAVQLCIAGSRRKGAFNIVCGLLATLVVVRPWG